MSPGTLAGVDLGKTGCRAAVLDPASGRRETHGPGAPGLAEPGGADAAEAAVRAVLARARDGAPDGPRIEALAVGAAGAEAARAAARRLAEGLGTVAGSVAVASDSVTAHAGALAGRPGTVLAVGTGSVALGVGPDGRLHQRGGWGPWLGDDGSGAWIGRAALRAVLAAREGWAPPTALTPAAEARFGELAAVPGAVHASGGIARTVAAFAPEVLAVAEAGDAVAAGIAHDAVTSWLALVHDAAEAAGVSEVAVVGGLSRAAPLVADFGRRLAARLRLVPAVGGSLDGAVLLAGRRDLPHEVSTVRID